MRFLPYSVLLVLLATVGCTNRGPTRFQLSGLVTYQGNPVPAGTLLFAPDKEKKNDGPGVLVEIKDGKYQTEPGKGVVGGPHLVYVEGFDGKSDPVEQIRYGKPIFPQKVLAEDLPKKDAVMNFDIKGESKRR